MEDYDNLYSNKEKSLLHSPSKLDIQIKDIAIVQASLEEEYDKLQNEYKRLIAQSIDSNDPTIQKRINNIKPQLEKKANQIYLLQRYKRLNLDSHLSMREKDLADRKTESLRILRDFKELSS